MIGRFRPAVLATALFAVVAGCAGGSVQSGEVRPITDILESEIVVDVDASATTCSAGRVCSSKNARSPARNTA